MPEKSDAKLLLEYSRNGNEDAFRDLVLRHTDLVFSAALRQVASPDCAQDVAQQVFIDLAQKARKLGEILHENASVAGWLYRSTRYASLNYLRESRRRQGRENEYMQQMQSPSEPPPDWNQISQCLDEAVATLRESEREALLLRYFQAQDYRSMGLSLGISDDAAQKRVTRALESLRMKLKAQVGSISGTALASALGSHALIGAPAGLAQTLSRMALSSASTAWAVTGTAVQTAVMTTTNKIALTVVLGAMVATSVFQHQRIAALKEEMRLLEQKESLNRNELISALGELRDATNRIAGLTLEKERLRQNTPEVLRLRGKIGTLTGELKDSREMQSDPTYVAAKSLVDKVEILENWLAERPEQRIPEFDYLREENWVDAVKDYTMQGEHAPGYAARDLREKAKREFAHQLSNALRRFVDENGGRLPSDLSELNPYFAKPMPPQILDSYKLLRPEGTLDPSKERWLVAEIAPPFDQNDDKRMMIGLNDFLLVRREGISAP